MIEHRHSPDQGAAGLHTASVLAQLAVLRTASTPALKAQWRALFGAEPPAFSRRYLQSRLAFRVQELAYGGLKPETVQRLEWLGERLDGGKPQIRRVRQDNRPIPGTRLVREYHAGSSILSPCWPTAMSGSAGPTDRSPLSPAPSPARGGTAGYSSA